MRRDKIAILVLIVVFSATFIACGNGGTEESKAKTWVGTLDSWDVANGTVTIDGSLYPIAVGMKDFEDRAEVGKKYEFKTDEHGNITVAAPQ